MEALTTPPRRDAVIPFSRLQRHLTRRRFLAVAAALVLAAPAACSNATVATGLPVTSEAALLDDVQQRTFQWFWDTTNPANGLTPDRWPTRSFSSVAATGFALTNYPVGVERGWVTREAARARVLTTLRFLYRAPQGEAAAGMTGHKGFFYHFLHMDSGQRFEQVELSTVDTALLIGGVLVCREFFDGAHPDEEAIRAYADSLYHRVDWRWAQPRAPLISMGWKPEEGYLGWDWRGYNEGMLVLVLALGSPTFPVDAAAWDAWTGTYQWGTFQGQPHVGFAPLFGHQYSHVWIDFRGIQDAYMRARGIDYFENSRRATIAQRQYAIANPRGFRDYGPDIWGLTAADGPLDTTVVVDGVSRVFQTYAARGASFTEIRDDGTLAPTAAGGSVPFAPEIAIPALRAMRDRYGAHLYGRYGFLDSFNPTYRLTRTQHGRTVPGVGWFDTDHLGIDQGPILAMIENHRSELIWRLMRRNDAVIRGLRRAGFQGGWLDRAPATR